MVGQVQDSRTAIVQGANQPVHCDGELLSSLLVRENDKDAWLRLAQALTQVSGLQVATVVTACTDLV